jgi:Tol biopolymer transport system component
MVAPPRRGRPLRVLAILGLAALFGWGVYSWLGSLKSPVARQGAGGDPMQNSVLFNLPGTIVVPQGGNLYRLQNGHFTLIASGHWTQPAVTPDHQHLVAVQRAGNVSDLYELSTSGAIQRQLTSDASGTVDLNHWSFFPHVSPAGTSVFYSYDQKTCQGCYLVELSIFSQPLGAPQSQARRWSRPNQGTGGDLNPIPLESGGLLYSKFQVDGATNQVVSQIWYQRAQGTTGVALSPAGQSCQQPALSPSGTEVAMICQAEGSQTNRLVVAPLDLGQFTLGPETVLATGLAASPAWSPDGKGLLYFAPQSETGPFQLFYVKIPTKGPPSPKAVTSNDSFDSTAPAVWYG